jgi:alkylated DNA nucleotide flippase Atl1
VTPLANSCTSANFDPSMFKGTNRDLAAALIEIINELRHYWPVTVRQAYYRAVAALLIENHLNEYRRISRILATLRREDKLPWHCIEDRTRRTVDKRGVPNVREHIEAQIEQFLNPRYYGRCYIQNQDAYVEVATEKDALASILEEAVWMYCTRLNVVRGQVSATMVNQMAVVYRVIWDSDVTINETRFDRAETRCRDPCAVSHNRLW